MTGRGNTSVSGRRPFPSVPMWSLNDPSEPTTPLLIGCTVSNIQSEITFVHRHLIPPPLRHTVYWQAFEPFSLSLVSGGVAQGVTCYKYPLEQVGAGQHCSLIQVTNVCSGLTLLQLDQVRASNIESNNSLGWARIRIVTWSEKIRQVEWQRMFVEGPIVLSLWVKGFNMNHIKPI